MDLEIFRVVVINWDIIKVKVVIVINNRIVHVVKDLSKEKKI